MQRPKGTEDFLPEDMEIRDKVFSSLRSTASSYGYKEISTPAFEPLSLLTKKEGDEIKEQIFTLEKRSKEEFGLRFDLTVPITRVFLEKQKSITKPVKWFALDRMWRYEQPQKGRLREFYQLSVELFGANTIYADAEIISLAIDCLKNLGLTEKDFYINLNSRNLLQALLAGHVPKPRLEDAIRLIDKRSKVSEADFKKELASLGANPETIISLLSKKLEDISPDDKSAGDDLRILLDILGDKKKFIRFDLSTARGLAYYTGLVFEAVDTAAKFRALLGGGRYDNLIGMFGGQPTPATGFGIGYSTLALLLKEKGLLKAEGQPIDYYIAPLGKDAASYAFKVAEKLRSKATVEIDLMQRNLGNQFKYANKIRASKVILIGEDELNSGKLTLKDMRTGKEEKKALSDI